MASIACIVAAQVAVEASRPGAPKDLIVVEETESSG
jgi:hypothetical protein